MPQTRRLRSSTTPQKDVSSDVSNSKDIQTSTAQLCPVSENGTDDSEPNGVKSEELSSSDFPVGNISDESKSTDGSVAAAAEDESIQNPLHESNEDVKSSNPTSVIELRCQVCNCSFTNYHEHMNSETHKASRNSKAEIGVNSSSASPKPQTPKRPGGPVSEKSTPPQKKIKTQEGVKSEVFSCDVCKLKITRKQDFELHLAGKRHNIAKQKAAGKAHCERCYLFFNTVTELHEHMNSQLHKTNSAEKKPDTEVFFCDICDVSSVGLRQRDQHLHSRRHRQRSVLVNKCSESGRSVPNSSNGQPDSNIKGSKKKWLYVCNGCNYYTNDDNLLKNHLNKAEHKSAVIKMKEAGLMCGTPGPTLPQSTTLTEVEPASSTGSQGGKPGIKDSSVVCSSRPAVVSGSSGTAAAGSTSSGAVSVGIKSAQPIVSVTPSSKTAQSETSVSKTKNQPPIATDASRKNTKKSPQGIKPLSSINVSRPTNNQFASQAKQPIGGNFNAASHFQSNTVPQAVYNSGGSFGPNARTVPPLTSSFVPAVNVNNDRPQLVNDLRRNYHSDIGEGFEGGRRQDISRLERGSGPRDMYFDKMPKDPHSCLTGDMHLGMGDIRSGNEVRSNLFSGLRKDFHGDYRADTRGDLDVRREFRGGIGNEAGELHSSSIRKCMPGDLRDDELSNRVLRDVRGDYFRDGRAEMQGDMRLDSRPNLWRDGQSDLRTEFRHGGSGMGDLHSEISGFMKRERQNDTADYRNFSRMELPRDSRDDFYRERSTQSGFSGPQRLSYGGGGGDDFRLQNRYESGLPMESRSSGSLPASRVDMRRNPDSSGGGEYWSRFPAAPLSGPFMGSMSRGGR